MWLNKKLRLIQAVAGNAPGHSTGEQWVVVQLKAGYTAKTFPPAEGQRVSENFYKFIASLPSDPVGIYRIVGNETLKPDTSYQIGHDVAADLKVWRYERATQRLFFGGIGTTSGTPETEGKNTVDTTSYLVLNDAIPMTNGFVPMSGGYGTGDVLIHSWTEKPFKGAGKIYWEPY